MGLTMLRLLLLPVFLWLLLADAGPQSEGLPHPHRWWAVGIFAVMAATDKLDGYLARRLNQVSKLGTVLDPVADKLLIASSVVLLSFDWVASPGYAIALFVVAAVYGKDLLVALGAVALLYLTGKVTVRPRILGKASTVLQLTLVILTLIAPDLDSWFPPRYGWHAVRWLGALVAGLAVLACIDYVVVGVRQFRQSRRMAAVNSIDS
jgi:CDP-diacylglycerol--glycerol-3-phosphate 3-phosphatidyltransferase